ncbi:MAG: PCRF domain-containing protein [Candidatus Pacebacteria bacterium]|nr:PCRF domain-containing protein [Candidatus Paceibacterota bacterium]
MSAVNHPYQAQIEQLETKIKENQVLLDDDELADLAQEEISKLETQLKTLKKAAVDYQQSLEEEEAAKADPTHQSKAIVEIRAGAGGDEAKIWASDLLRMYTRYCESKNLKVEFIDDLVFRVNGQTSLDIPLTAKPEQNDQSSNSKQEGVELLDQTKTVKFFPYKLLKQETGVHRVQRIPVTETQGRIHTSTASVAVLPEIKSKDIEIKEEDLEWEFMRASGAGGQSVNKTSSAVRLTHQPSGIVVRVSQERKQLQNRQIALELLRAQLWEIEEEKRQQKLGNARAAIGRNMRAEKIRTYNYPQNRVTDHRVHESWHQLENIIEGSLDAVISTVKAKLG